MNSTTLNQRSWWLLSSGIESSK